MDFIGQLMANIPFLVFFLVGTVAVASSILVVAMRNPVHSALFLLVSFLSVAILFFLVGAEFVGAVQILVYAGGIMVLFLFVVMLVNVRRMEDEPMLSRTWKGALGVGLAIFVVFASVVRTGEYATPVDAPENFGRKTVRISRRGTNEAGQTVIRRYTEQRSTNTETVGMALYSEYVVPFEIASLFLLVAMIGAIIIGKRELVGEEEAAAAYIADKARREREIKRAADA